MEFAVVVEQTEDGWLLGQLQEMPRVVFKGKMLEELKENLRDALLLVWEEN